MSFLTCELCGHVGPDVWEHAHVDHHGRYRESAYCTNRTLCWQRRDMQEAEKERQAKVA